MNRIEGSVDMNNKKKHTFLMGIFDVLFIMILCFATLLTTMLMQGGVLVGADGTSGMHYTFDLLSFSLVIAGFAAYMAYIIPRSDKELREMTLMHYGDKAHETAVTGGIE